MTGASNRGINCACEFSREPHLCIIKDLGDHQMWIGLGQQPCSQRSVCMFSDKAGL